MESLNCLLVKTYLRLSEVYSKMLEVIMTTLTRQQAADYIGVCIATFKKIQKDIRAIRIGRRVFFDVKDLDAYLESKKVGGKDDK